MQELRIRATGISALLLNSPGGMKPQDATASIGAKTVHTPEADAESSAYRMPDGQLYLPAAAFRSSLLAAGVGLRIGKRGATAVLSGTVFSLDDVAPLTNPDTGEAIKDFVIDQRRVVVQKAGIIRSRPRIERWSTVVNFEFDDEILNPEVIVDTMTRAGRTVGVGDYRPQRSGPFGRFTVEQLN